MQSAENSIFQNSIVIEKSVERESWGVRARNFIGAICLCFFIGVLVALVSGYFEYKSTFAPEAIARIVKQAAGTVPVSYPDNAAAKALRDLFREVLDIRRQSEQASRRYHTPEMEQLFQAESVSSIGRVQQTLAQLRDLEELDAQYEREYAAAREHFGESVERLDHSRFAPFLATCRKHLDRTIDHEIQLAEKDRKCIGAAIDLYTFAMRNFAFLSVRGNRLYIGNAAVLQQYKAKLSNARGLAAEVQALNEQEAANRNSAMAKLHVSSSDIDAF